MVKILVADDHSIVREGLIKSLTGCIPNTKCQEACNAAETLEFVRKEKWNLLMLDINMPGRSGLEIIKEVKDISPDLPIIILSMYPEDVFAVRVIKAGASSYIAKNTSSADIIKTVKKILNGEIYLSPSISHLIADELRQKTSKPLHETLSDREFQVFTMIAGGKSVSIIADELSLSVKTISVYRSNILQKMNLKNNSEITHYAFKNGLVE